MNSSNITYKLTGKTLVISAELSDAQASASGKTMVVVSTAGNKPTGIKYEGKELVAGINIYFKP